MSSCCLCGSLSATTPAPWDQPFLESDNFVVVPSLGSIVAGWSLIVPRRHFVAIGALPRPYLPELEHLKLRTTKFLESAFGPCCAFEHGPYEPSRPIGCGVDHAHLHIVPLPFDLLNTSAAFLPKDIRWSPGDFDSCVQAFDAGADYLYVEQPIGEGRIALHSQIPSQAFRRVIATSVGQPDSYDWRSFPQLPVVQRTLSVIQRGRT